MKINRNKEGSGFNESSLTRQFTSVFTVVKSLGNDWGIWLQAHFAGCYKLCLYIAQMHTQEANLTATVQEQMHHLRRSRFFLDHYCALDLPVTQFLLCALQLWFILLLLADLCCSLSHPISWDVSIVFYKETV